MMIINIDWREISEASSDDRSGHFGCVWHGAGRRGYGVRAGPVRQVLHGIRVPDRGVPVRAVRSGVPVRLLRPAFRQPGQPEVVALPDLIAPQLSDGRTRSSTSV